MNHVRLSAVLAILALSGCGDISEIELGSASTIQSPVINGTKCLPDQHESAVELIIDADIDYGPLGKNRITTFMCGGTLIAPDVVMTAAHCLDISDITMGIGVVKSLTYYISTDDDFTYMDSADGAVIPKDAFKVSKTMVYENYARNGNDGLGSEGDIGLVFLEKPMAIKPAMLITKEEASQIVKDTAVSIAGWGRTKAKKKRGEKVSGIKFCAESTINEANAYEMQIGSDLASSKKCFGDSGGPTYMQVNTPMGQETRVIGITSHAYDEAMCEKGGIDTRADAYLDWIDGKMREGCASGTRSWCEESGVIQPSYVNSISNFQLIKTFLFGFFGY